MASLLTYGISSILLILMSKTLLSSYDFNFPVLLCLFHLVFCFITCLVARGLGLVSFQTLDMSSVRLVGPVSFLFMLNTIVGLVSLHSVSIPTFTSLRRLNGLFILFLEWFLTRRLPSKYSLMSLAVIITGSIIIGYNDVNFDVLSYAYVFLNNVCTSSLLISLKYLDSYVSLTSLSKTYYNSMFSIPFLLFFALGSGEILRLKTFPFLWDIDFQILLFLSASFATSVNISTAWCASETDPLTTSVAGQFKNMTVSFAGLFFSDVVPSLWFILGLCTTILGSCAFAFTRYAESAAAFEVSKYSQTRSDSSQNDSDIEMAVLSSEASTAGISANEWDVLTQRLS